MSRTGEPGGTAAAPGGSGWGPLSGGSLLPGAASVPGLWVKRGGERWKGREGEVSAGGPCANGSRPHGQSSPPPSIFFDSCDGFFTNYNWREEHLERMLVQAGERRADVYVGVDVFARGNVVGGQFDTHKVGVALGAGGRGDSGRCAFCGPGFLVDLPFPSALKGTRGDLRPGVGETGDRETPVTCPKARLCPEILTSVPFSSSGGSSVRC